MIIIIILSQKKKKKIDRPKLTHAGREYLCESSGTHNKREKSLAFNLHFHQLTASIFAFRLRRRKVSPIFRSNLQFNLSSNFTNVYVEICGSHQFATFLTKVLFFIQFYMQEFGYVLTDFIFTVIISKKNLGFQVYYIHCCLMRIIMLAEDVYVWLLLP